MVNMFPIFLPEMHSFRMLFVNTVRSRFIDLHFTTLARVKINVTGKLKITENVEDKAMVLSKSPKD